MVSNKRNSFNSFVIIIIIIVDLDNVRICLLFFFVFLPFLGPLPWHMEVSRLEVESEL